MQTAREAHVVRAQPARQHRQARGDVSRLPWAQGRPEDTGQPPLSDQIPSDRPEDTGQPPLSDQIPCDRPEDTGQPLLQCGAEWSDTQWSSTED